MNNDQKIVLEWLQEELEQHPLTNVLWLLTDDALELDYDTYVSEAWNRLDMLQQLQVLNAFAELELEELTAYE